MHTTSASTALPRITLQPAFALALAVATTNGFARFAYALLLPAMRTDLGWSYATAGWMNTANAIGYVLGAVSGYLLLRRIAPAVLFCAGIVSTMLFLAITGWQTSLPWLLGTRLACGIGAAWVFGCGGALIAEAYAGQPRLRGWAIGIFFAGGGLGIALSGMLLGPFLAHFGNVYWPQAWLALGLLGALLSLAPLAVARGSAASAAGKQQSIPLAAFIVPMAAYFLFAAGCIIYMTFLFAWLRDARLSWQFASGTWILLGAAIMLSPLLWRRTLDHWPPAKTMAAAIGLTCAGVVLCLLEASRPLLLASAFGFGLGVFIVPAAVTALVRESSAPAQWAQGVTAFTIVFSIGQALGPVLGGIVADAGGLTGTLWLAAALLALAALPLMFSAPRAALDSLHD